MHCTWKSTNLYSSSYHHHHHHHPFVHQKAYKYCIYSKQLTKRTKSPRPTYKFLWWPRYKYFFNRIFNVFNAFFLAFIYALTHWMCVTPIHSYGLDKNPLGGLYVTAVNQLKCALHLHCVGASMPQTKSS